MTSSSPRILVIGATSAIAQAVIRQWAAVDAPRFFLAARDAERLQAVAHDARVRGAADVHTGTFDAEHAASWERVVRDAQAALGGFDVVLIAHGWLPSQAACERDPSVAARAFTINATSVIALSLAVATILEAQGHGTLAVIGSVSGDRIRRSMQVYGSAKQAVAGFLDGLRQRFDGTPVRILTIKPGYVRTPMIAHLPSSPLTASPARVARDMIRAIRGGRVRVLYTPWFWWGISFIVRRVPTAILRLLP